jgi:hypothetical protein
MIHTIVKIDLCKSKKFAREREGAEPEIREITLEKLLKVSQNSFPFADVEFPNGSFYKTEGDAVIYIFEKPTVAVRASIEFMQKWYYEALPDFPECKIFIDRSSIEEVKAPKKGEFIEGP